MEVATIQMQICIIEDITARLYNVTNAAYMATAAFHAMAEAAENPTEEISSMANQVNGFRSQIE